jgi:prepilin-type processing-associated H-X9-DG protein
LDRTEKIIVSAVVAALMIAGAGLFLFSLAEPKLKADADNTKCVSNLKMLGLAMLLYANDNQMWLPDSNGAAGLNQTVQYGGNAQIFFCPATKSQYLYQGGIFLPACDSPSSTPLIWEPNFPHDGKKNVVFLDGHCEGVSPAEWGSVSPNTKKAVKLSKQRAGSGGSK